MSITIKAYLKIGDNASGEIRRFEMDPGECTNFECVIKRLMHVFPSLANESIKVSWKDSEGDLIAFSSDEELAGALGQLSEDVFRIYIQKNEKPSEVPDEGSGGVFQPSRPCRGCGVKIGGPCFKCLVCHEYFLCKHCEKIGTHLEHDLIRIRKRKFSTSGVKMDYHVIPPCPSPNGEDVVIHSSQHSTGTTFGYSDAHIVIPGAMKGRGTFLTPKEVLHLMTSQQPSAYSVPPGLKENVYFLLNNSENIFRRQNSMHAVYVDDCGAWAYSSLKTHYYIIKGVEHNLEYVDRKDGVYCRASKRQRVPLVPQPKEENIISFKRYYLSLKRSKTYRKRVSTVYMCPEHLNSLKFLVVIEYIGPYPPVQLPHGNSKTATKEYKRKPKVICATESGTTENDEKENDGTEQEETEQDETKIALTEDVVSTEEALATAINSIQNDLAGSSG